MGRTTPRPPRRRRASRVHAVAASSLAEATQQLCGSLALACQLRVSLRRHSWFAADHVCSGGRRPWTKVGVSFLSGMPMINQNRIHASDAWWYHRLSPPDPTNDNSSRYRLWVRIRACGVATTAAALAAHIHTGVSVALACSLTKRVRTATKANFLLNVNAWDRPWARDAGEATAAWVCVENITFKWPRINKLRRQAHTHARRKWRGRRAQYVPVSVFMSSVTWWGTIVSVRNLRSASAYPKPDSLTARGDNTGAAQLKRSP